MKVETLITAGIAFIILGFVLVIAGSMLSGMPTQKKGTDTQKGEDSTVKFSFVGLIGPFPLGFGNDKNLFVTTLVIAFSFMLVAYFLLRSGVGP